jgi:hypothetical protein
MDTIKRAEKHTNYVKVTHKLSDYKIVAILFAAVLFATKQQYMTWECFITER